MCLAKVEKNPETSAGCSKKSKENICCQDENYADTCKCIFLTTTLLIFGLFVNNLTPRRKYAKYERVLNVVDGQNVTVLEARFVPILHDFFSQKQCSKGVICLILK